MGLLNFFIKVGRVLRGAFAVIQKVVPEVQLVAAIELARDDLWVTPDRWRLRRRQCPCRCRA